MIHLEQVWITDLNVWPRNIKLLEEKIGKYLCHLELGKDFLAMTPKAWSRKEKEWIHWTSLKLRTSASKDTFNRMKGQATDWKKTFANHIPDKGFVSKTQITLKTQ